MGDFYSKTLVVGAGAEKCATTSFYDWLSSSGSRSIPRRKETFYFTRNFSNGESWFQSLYKQSAGDVIFDITPSYFRDQEGVRRIADSPFTRKKVLFFMRSQIARAYSFYCHDIVRHISKGQRFLKGFSVRRSFSFYDLQGNDYYFTTYSDKLVNLRRTFGRDSVMPIIFEHFILDPHLYVDRLEEFLEMDLERLRRTPFPRSNESPLPYFLYSSTGCGVPLNGGQLALKAKTVQVFRDGTPAEVIEGSERAANAIFCYGTWTRVLPKLHVEAMYGRYFREDTAKLERLTGLDLSVWYEHSERKAREVPPGD